MVRFYIKGNFYLFLLAGLLCLIISYYFDKIRKHEINEKQTEALVHKFQKHLEAEFIGMQGAFPDNRQGWIAGKQIKEKKYSLHIYKSDSLIYWDNNAIENLNHMALTLPMNILVLHNGIFLVEEKNKGDSLFVLFYRLRNNFQLNNTYLKNTLNPDFGIDYPCSISLSPIEGFRKVELSFGISIFIKFDSGQSYSVGYLLLFLVGLLFICMALRYVLDDLFRIDFVLGLSFLLATIIGVRIIMISLYYPQYFYDKEIFNPEYFASSQFLHSLGDLLVTVIFLGIAVLVSVFYLIRLKVSNAVRTSAIGKVLLIIYIFLSAFFTFKIIHDLVIDSRISFDLTNIFDLSWYSLTGVLIIAGMYIVTIKLAHIYSREYMEGMLFTRNNFVQIGVLLLSVFILKTLRDSYIWDKIFTAAFFLILIDIARRIFILKTFVIRHLTYAIIFSIVAAFTFYQDVNEKEVGDRLYYANKLTTQIDYRAEELLKQEEQKILNDSAFLNRCVRQKLINTVATQYITNNYINNYLEKFDCSAYVFLNDSSSSATYNYNQTELNNIFSRGVLGISDNFRFVKSPAQFFGYIGKFEILSEGKNLKIYILLKLQPYQEDNLLPILVADKAAPVKRNKLRYSYAIYSNKKLMQQAGRFQYQTQYGFEKVDSNFKVVNRDGFSHLLYKDADELTVVVSSKAPSMLSILANALCLFLVILTAGVLILLCDFLINVIISTPVKSSAPKKFRAALFSTRRKYDIINIKFSTRIIINILGLVLFIFTATTFFTIRYIDDKIKEESKAALINKLKAVNKYFTEEKILHGIYTSNEKEVNVLKASVLFTTDINIYDSDGKLFLSSKPEIFREGLLSHNINYEAYYNIIEKKASLYTQNEAIGELQYTSYYQPYYDGTGLRFIINTPYFTRNIEHNAQISMFIVNFLNLYVALLLIMFIIAYWVAKGTTQPFILLRDKIKSLSLERDNELLSWQRNDEIGELIKQYNSMVLDLKESRQNLANSERTEAWREMAKQVAHDIKNPLTPMKLNLQYLQKAIEANDEDLHQKFKNISQSLIEQINSLTEMANNFGNFAKAPDASPQVLDVNEELQNLIELYKATDFVEINGKFSSTGIRIWMDKNHFRRAIGNIIKNAIQAIPQGKEGVIEILLNNADKRCTLIIKDNGIGIPKEMEHMIFIPNFSTKTSGSGIGLSIAKTMIENAGGNISFYSTLNKGTTFIVEFPVYKES